MRKVQTHHVHAGIHKAAQRLHIPRCWSDRANDLYDGASRSKQNHHKHGSKHRAPNRRRRDQSMLSTAQALYVRETMFTFVDLFETLRVAWIAAKLYHMAWQELSDIYLRANKAEFFFTRWLLL